MKPNPNWRGDPTFLKSTLEYWGLEVAELPGWLNRGHGDFGVIQGIIVHHIGANKYDPHNIAHHPTLGLCSQIHLSRSGKVTLCGVGIAYHAGLGSYPGWPTNNANWVSIGIEAESDGVTPWPQEQLDAYYKLCAAILWFLGKRATTATLLSHWEYSNKAQGKWDPGAGNGRSGAMMEMNGFRAEVNKLIDNPPGAEKEVPVGTTFDTRVAASDGSLHPLKNLIVYTDGRVFELYELLKHFDPEQLDRVEEKLDRVLEVLEHGN